MLPDHVHALVVAVGCAHHRVDVEALRGRVAQKDAGMVVELDQQHRPLDALIEGVLFAQAADPAEVRLLQVALEAGWAPMRDGDEVGLSVAQTRNGGPYVAWQAPQVLNRAETTLELSYLAQVTKWLTLQPDLQCVIHPNTDPSLAAAWVVQLRFEIAF